jgi:phosphoglycolate phosphatase
LKYDLIIFDFDGTLADSFPWFRGVYNQVADRYGLRCIDEAEQDTLRGFDSRRIIRYLGIPISKIPLIATHMRRLMTRDIRHISLFEGIDDLLRGLHSRGAVLAVVTSNSRENVVQIMGEEIAALITYLECGASIFGKRARIRKILERSGIPRGKAIYIGDEIRDIEAARKERIASGAVTWGYTHALTLEDHSPAELFADIDDIRKKTG